MHPFFNGIITAAAPFSTGKFFYVGYTSVFYSSISSAGSTFSFQQGFLATTDISQMCATDLSTTIENTYSVATYPIPTAMSTSGAFSLYSTSTPFSTYYNPVTTVGPNSFSNFCFTTSSKMSITTPSSIVYEVIDYRSTIPVNITSLFPTTCSDAIYQNSISAISSPCVSFNGQFSISLNGCTAAN